MATGQHLGRAALTATIRPLKIPVTKAYVISCKTAAVLHPHAGILYAVAKGFLPHVICTPHSPP